MEIAGAIAILTCLPPLAMLVAAGYPLASGLGLSWPARLLAAMALGLVGGPALAWAAGVLLPFLRPELPVLVLALWGIACLVRDLRRSRPWSRRLERGPFLVLGAMLIVTALQCSVVVGTHWERGSLVIANLHSHDALWHLAIAALLRPDGAFATPWPPPNPVWADERLVNYHPLTDVLVALLAPHDGQVSAYFHVLPPVYGLLFTGSTAWVARRWGASYPAAAFTVLLAGLCGSLGHLVALLTGEPPVWASAFWLSQPSSMCYNPPLSLSYGVLLVGLALLSRARLPLPPTAAALAVLWGASFGVKAYLPALVLPSLALAALLAPAPERRGLAVLLGAMALGAGALFLLTTRGASGLLVYDPGWLVWTLLGQGDRIGVLVTRTLEALPGEARPAAVVAWLAAGVPLYVAGNLGVRMVGLGPAWRAFVGRAEVAPGTLAAQRTAFGISVLGLLLPLLFRQAGINWNSIQFAYYLLALIPLWAAPRLLTWISGPRGTGMRLLRGAVLTLLALPTTVQMLTLNSGGTIIPASEVAALRELRSRVPVGGVIAVQPGPVPGRPTPQSRGYYAPIDPTGNAYVAALTGRPTYYADPITLEILLLPGKRRLTDVQWGLSQPEPARREWLAARGIQAVYTVPPE